MTYLAPFSVLFLSFQVELAEKLKLQGSWIVVSCTWNGATMPLTGKEKGIVVPTMVFTADRVKSSLGFTEAKETLTYRIDPRKTPKHLDLTPIEGEDRTTRCCIYSVTDDELRIAFTAWVAFGTEEETRRDSIRMNSTRPRTLDPDRGDCVTVWTLMRVKK